VITICGIAGFSISDADHAAGTFNANLLAKALLNEIEYRGSDATGMSWFTSKGTVALVKQPLPARAFNEKFNMWRGARTAVLHTRAYTKGSPTNPLNNHPIKYGTRYGVHNGWLYNDDDLFETYQAVRHGQVDSEAIWMVLDKAKGEIEDKLQLIQGPAALAWLDLATPDVLYMSRVQGNPVTVVTTRNNSVIMASGHNDPQLALKALGLEDEIDRELELVDGEFCEVKYGMIDNMRTFDPPAGWSYINRPFTPTTARAWNSAFSNGSGAGHGIDLRRHAASNTLPVAGGRKAHAHTAHYSPSGELEHIIDHSDGSNTKYYSWGAYYAHRAEVENPHEITNYEAVLSGNRIPPEAFDTAFLPRVMPIDVFEEEYGIRCKAIQDYAVTSQEVFEFLGDIRPGMWVQTHLLDRMVGAQVLTVPDTFPDGKWLLRAYVTYEDADDNEFVMLRRETSELYSYEKAD
jgi:hypothetical protein